MFWIGLILLILGIALQKYGDDDQNKTGKILFDVGKWVLIALGIIIVICFFIGGCTALLSL